MKSPLVAMLASLTLSSFAAFAAPATSDLGTDSTTVNDGAIEHLDGTSRDHYRRYEWVFSYIDRNDGCQSCDFGCNAPRCSSDTVHLKKACRVPGTRDDSYVYTCLPRDLDFPQQ